MSRSRHMQLQICQDPKLPRLIENKHGWVYNLPYTWKCVGRGSLGYGYTKEHAYAQWHKNWQRRLRFYSERAPQADLILAHMKVQDLQDLH